MDTGESGVLEDRVIVVMKMEIHGVVGINVHGDDNVLYPVCNPYSVINWMGERHYQGSGPLLPSKY